MYFRSILIYICFGFAFDYMVNYALQCSKLHFYVSDMELDETLQLLYDHSMKANIQKTYNSAQIRFVKLPSLYNFAPCPASESILLFYV